MWISAMTNRVVLLFPCPRVVRTGTICFDCWVELLAVFNQFNLSNLDDLD